MKNQTSGQIQVHAKGGVENAVVVNGAFAIPTLETLAGKFRITLTSDKGEVTRTVTKDNSHYFVVIED